DVEEEVELLVDELEELVDVEEEVEVDELVDVEWVVDELVEVELLVDELVDVELVLEEVAATLVVVVTLVAGGRSGTSPGHLLRPRALKQLLASGHRGIPHMAGIFRQRQKHGLVVHRPAQSWNAARHASSAAHRHRGAGSEKQSAGNSVAPKSHGGAS